MPCFKTSSSSTYFHNIQHYIENLVFNLKLLHEFIYQYKFLQEDTMRVIWSYDSFTPDPTDRTFPHHDHRGTKSIYLKEPRLTQYPDAKYLDIRAPNVSI